MYFRDQASYNDGVRAERNRIRQALDGYVSSEQGFRFPFTHADGSRTLVIMQATSTVGWAVVAFVLSVATHLRMLRLEATRLALELIGFDIALCIFLWPLGGLSAFNRCVEGTDIQRATVPPSSPAPAVNPGSAAATPPVLSEAERARRQYDKCVHENAQRSLRAAHGADPATLAPHVDCVRASGGDLKRLKQE